MSANQANQEISRLSDLLDWVLDEPTAEQRKAMAADLLVHFNDNKGAVHGVLRWLYAYKLNGWMPHTEEKK